MSKGLPNRIDCIVRLCFIMLKIRLAKQGIEQHEIKDQRVNRYGDAGD